MKNIGNLFRIGLLSFLVGCCAGGAFQDTRTSTLQPPSNTSHALEIERLRQSTVAIVSNTLGLLIPGCAGVWIDSDVVLTAAHCVDDPDKPFVLLSTVDDFEQGKVRPGTVIAQDPRVDLALVELDPDNVPPHPIVMLADKTPLVGDEVHIVGHTVGFDWTYSHGYISAVRDDMPGPKEKMFKKALQITAPVWMGNSGGGAFNSMGQLVGISSWVALNGPQLSFFVHVDLIESFMIKELAVRKK